VFTIVACGLWSLGAYIYSREGAGQGITRLESGSPKMNYRVHENRALVFLRDNYLLILIFLLGLGLRIYDLGAESIWYDEAVSIAVSKLSIFEQLKWNLTESDNNPPLYYAILHFWVSVFGDSEFSSRLPSAIFGSLTIFAIYGLGNLLFDRKTGLIAALILATSVFHVWFSQEARAYTLLTLLTLVSFYYFVKLLSAPQDKFYMAAYLVSGVLLLYTHYYGLPVIAAQNIYCFTQYLRRRKPGRLEMIKWVKLQLVLLLFFLPVSVLLIKHGSAVREGFWITPPAFSEVLGYFLTYSGSAPILYLLVIFSLFSVVSLGDIKNVRNYRGFLKPFDDSSGASGIPYRSRVYLLIVWMLSLILIPFLISRIMTPVLIYRYTIGASPVLYLLASKGVSGTNNNKLMIIFAGLIMVFSFVNIEKNYSRIDKFQWREAVADIETNAGYGDILAVYPRFELEPVRYYSRRGDILKGPLVKDFFSPSEARDKNIWVMVSTHWGIDKEVLKEELRKKYDFVAEKKYANLDVYKLKIKREGKTTALTP